MNLHFYFCLGKNKHVLHHDNQHYFFLEISINLIFALSQLATKQNLGINQLTLNSIWLQALMVGELPHNLIVFAFSVLAKPLVG